MKRLILGLVTAAVVVVPADASAAEIPPINCGIVSCTYPIEKLLDDITGAPSAQAYVGPCAQQRALFEKYNIQLDMDAPLVGAAYGEACRQTG